MTRVSAAFLLLLSCLSAPRAGEPPVPAGSSEPDWITALKLSAQKDDSAAPLAVPVPPPKVSRRGARLRFFLGRRGRRKAAVSAAAGALAAEPRIVVTGFEAFGAVAAGNPSGQAAMTLNGRRFSQYRVDGLVLPVSYQAAADKVSAILKEQQPAALIMFGVGSPEACVKVELAAYNEADQPDSYGGCPAGGGEVCAVGPPVQSGTPELKGLIEDLALGGTPVEGSVDPGDFVCNSTYYTALKAAADSKSSALVAFVHLPYATEYLTEQQRAYVESVPLSSILDWSARVIDGVVQKLSPPFAAR